ncbi:MAG: hypothetical protein QXV17_03030 [Candidatus Micrarchaeaceae archaeon]
MSYSNTEWKHRKYLISISQECIFSFVSDFSPRYPSSIAHLSMEVSVPSCETAFFIIVTIFSIVKFLFVSRESTGIFIVTIDVNLGNIPFLAAILLIKSSTSGKAFTIENLLDICANKCVNDLFTPIIGILEIPLALSKAGSEKRSITIAS